MCDAALDGRLDQVQAQWDPRCAIGVVLASEGYPGSYAKGEVISGLNVAQQSNIKVFHAGTQVKDGQVTTSGGRVLAVTALGATQAEARDKAYAACQKIHFEGMQYRSDIGA